MSYTVIARLVAGVTGAALIAVVSRRAGLLTRSGAWAAFGVGALTMSAGWPYAAAVLLFFVTATALSRWSRRRRPVERIVAKPGVRDAWQVLANGGVIALASLCALLAGPSPWLAVALGSMGAAMADTWATEIGTARGGTPRALTTWSAVAPGTSGAVSIAGSLAMIGGAAVMALLARASGSAASFAWSVFAAGLAGAMADTVVGATVQERRHCARCAEDTEQRVHLCGTPTQHARGIRGLANDAVNLVCTVTGGLVAGGLTLATAGTPR